MLMGLFSTDDPPPSQRELRIAYAVMGAIAGALITIALVVHGVRC